MNAQLLDGCLKRQCAVLRGQSATAFLIVRLTPVIVHGCPVWPTDLGYTRCPYNDILARFKRLGGHIRYAGTLPERRTNLLFRTRNSNDLCHADAFGLRGLKCRYSLTRARLHAFRSATQRLLVVKRRFVGVANQYLGIIGLIRGAPAPNFIGK